MKQETTDKTLVWILVDHPAKQGDEYFNHTFRKWLPVDENAMQKWSPIRRRLALPAALVVEPSLGGPEGVRDAVSESPPAGTDVPRAEWTYSPYRASLMKDGELFAIVTPDGKAALDCKKRDELLSLLNAGKPASTPPAEWKLPEPPVGREWHRNDWNEGMLPEGWRPVLLGEPFRPDVGDQHNWSGEWSNACDCIASARANHCHLRTQRPLPLPVESPASQVPVEASIQTRFETWASGKGLFSIIKSTDRDDFGEYVSQDTRMAYLGFRAAEDVCVKQGVAELNKALRHIQDLGMKCESLTAERDALAKRDLAHKEYTDNLRKEKQELETHIAEEKEKGIAVRDRAFTSEQENERLRALYAWVPTEDQMRELREAKKISDSYTQNVCACGIRAVFFTISSLLNKGLPPLPTAPVVEDAKEQFRAEFEEAWREMGYNMDRSGDKYVSETVRLGWNSAVSAFLAGQNSTKP